MLDVRWGTAIDGITVDKDLTDPLAFLRGLVAAVVAALAFVGRRVVGLRTRTLRGLGAFAALASLWYMRCGGDGGDFGGSGAYISVTTDGAMGEEVDDLREAAELGSKVFWEWPWGASDAWGCR